VSGTYTNMKFEIFTPDRDLAKGISNEVFPQLFDDFSGIAYVCNVDVLHALTLWLQVLPASRQLHW